jgi:hypothetical protein
MSKSKHKKLGDAPGNGARACSEEPLTCAHTQKKKQLTTLGSDIDIIFEEPKE